MVLSSTRWDVLWTWTAPEPEGFHENITMTTCFIFWKKRITKSLFPVWWRKFYQPAGSSAVAFGTELSEVSALAGVTSVQTADRSATLERENPQITCCCCRYLLLPFLLFCLSDCCYRFPFENRTFSHMQMEKQTYRWTPFLYRVTRASDQIRSNSSSRLRL